ncbi:MAG: hypothetical protein WAL26_22585 [Mycobacterium sp.]
MDLLDRLSLDVPVGQAGMGVDVAVVAFGGDRELVDELGEACYAGETALRMTSVTSARQAVADLAPGGH